MPQLNAALVPAPAQVVVRFTGDADLSTLPFVADVLGQAGGLGAQLVGDAVLVLDLLLAGDDGLADQLAHGVPDLAEVSSVHAAMVTPGSPRRASGVGEPSSELHAIDRLLSVVKTGVAP